MRGKHDPTTPRMYDEIADWFHLITAPEDYADEAAFTIDLLRSRTSGEIGTLLELGSGGGNLASNLPREIRLTLTDLSPAMLEVSRRLLPDVEHVQGDMRTLRLDRLFDAVVVHDAITYMLTEEDLRAALTTALVHLRPGGAACFQPDHVRETFEPTTEHGGHDGPDRALRYLEWAHEADPDATTTVTDYAYLMRDRDGSVRVLGDRHITGLFPEATWLRLLEEVGFQPDVVTDRYGRRIFTGVRPVSDEGS